MQHDQIYTVRGKGECVEDNMEKGRGLEERSHKCGMHAGRQPRRTLFSSSDDLSPKRPDDHCNISAANSDADSARLTQTVLSLSLRVVGIQSYSWNIVIQQAYPLSPSGLSLFLLAFSF